MTRKLLFIVLLSTSAYSFSLKKGEAEQFLRAKRGLFGSKLESCAEDRCDWEEYAEAAENVFGKKVVRKQKFIKEKFSEVYTPSSRDKNSRKKSIDLIKAYVDTGNEKAQNSDKIPQNPASAKIDSNLADTKFAEKFFESYVDFGDEKGEALFIGSARYEIPRGRTISTLSFGQRFQAFKKFLGLKSDKKVFDRIRELAETTCSNIISVTPEVFVNMKEVKKFVNSENHGRKTRSTHQKKKRPFWHARRLLCKDINFESTAARGKDGSCEVWYEFDNKNGLTPDWVDEEWLEHQVDRAFCLWSKFFDIHFRRTKPKDCHSPACLGQSSEIKITWAKSEKKYHYIHHESSLFSHGYRNRDSTTNHNIKSKSGKATENVESGFGSSVLAHAFPPSWQVGEDPVFSDVHLNADFDWVARDKQLQQPRGFMLFHTIVHEIGHTLGLGHNALPRDIMYTSQTGQQQFSFENPYAGMEKNDRINRHRGSVALGRLFYGRPDLERANATVVMEECETILKTLDPRDLPYGFKTSE